CRLIVVLLLLDCGGSAIQSPGYLSETPTAWLFIVIKEPGVGNMLPCEVVAGVAVGVPGPGVAAGFGIDAAVTLDTGANCPLSASTPRVPPAPSTTLRASKAMTKSIPPADRRGLGVGTLVAAGAVASGACAAAADSYE